MKYTKEQAELIKKVIADYREQPFDEDNVYGLEKFVDVNTEPVLKPCPFCGSLPIYTYPKEVVTCGQFMCPVHQVGFSVEVWNRRVGE